MHYAGMYCNGCDLGIASCEFACVEYLRELALRIARPLLAGLSNVLLGGPQVLKRDTAGVHCVALGSKIYDARFSMGGGGPMKDWNETLGEESVGQVIYTELNFIAVLRKTRRSTHSTSIADQDVEPARVLR